MKVRWLLFFSTMAFHSPAIYAQLAISNVATSPDPSAMLDVKSNSKGLLIPRTSSSSRTAVINPAKGLLIYDTTTESFWFHNGNAWTEISTGNSGWNMAGNTGTDATDFLGTTDNQSLNFKVHNLPAGTLNEINFNTFFGVNAGAFTSGKQNTALGYFALYNNATGTNNVAIGNKTLYAYTGAFNTAIGDSAIANTVNSSGNNYNTALGASSLTSNTSGYNNTATGAGSLFTNTTGNLNTSTGFNSLYKNVSGANNTAVGFDALYFNTSSNNTAAGTNALYTNTTGSDNTAQGYIALFTNSTGYSNTAAGSGAMNKNTLGAFNTVTGYQALYANTTGNNNTACGYTALFSNNTGSDNIAVGYQAMNSNTGGIYNSAEGAYALLANTTGSHNSAQGRSSLPANTTGTYNLAVGSGALNSNTVGSNNTVVGAEALSNNISGNNNVAIGYANLFNTTGNGNISVGYSDNQSSLNISVGRNALLVNTTGLNNIGVGNSSLLYNKTGFQNHALGDSSLLNNIQGFFNVAVGKKAMFTNTTGVRNTAIGFASLNNNVSGSENIAIGFGSIVNQTYNDATVLGAFATADCSDCTILGSVVASTKVGINNSAPTADLDIIQAYNANFNNSRGIELQQTDGGNQWRTFIDPGNNYVFQYNNNIYGYIDPAGASYHNFSDARLKKDIQPLTDVLNKVLQLKAVSYHYIKNEDSDPLLYGFIAQDVEKIFPDFVSVEGNGYKGMSYNNFSVVAIKALQERQLQIDELKNENELQQEQIDKLKRQLQILMKVETAEDKIL